MFHLEANCAVRLASWWVLFVALCCTSRTASAAGEAPATPATPKTKSGVCDDKSGTERLNCLLKAAKQPPLQPKSTKRPNPDGSIAPPPQEPLCRDWRTLAPFAEDAAQCLRNLTPEELGRIDAITWKALSSVISDCMERLHCAFRKTKDGDKRNEITQQLVKLFSGIGLTGDQAKVCVESIPQIIKDPDAFAELVRALLDKSQEGGLKADEVIAIHSRLQNPEVRKEFIRRLDSLGLSETPTGKALKADGPQPNLVDTLSKADRSVIAVGMSFLREVDARGTQALRTAKWMRLYIVDDRSQVGKTAKRDFAQALKELLTGFTNEGIEPETVGSQLTDDQIERDCIRLGADCGAVIRVRFAETNGKVVAEGRLIFNRTKSKDSNHESPPPSERPDITSPALDTSCDAAASASPGPGADQQRQCLTNQIHAAHGFMNALSERVALFGGLAFMKSPRRVETLAPSLHYGVTITDLMSPDPAQAPDILHKDLAVQSASPEGCGQPLLVALKKRLQKSYQSYIGDVAETGVVTATIEKNGNGCSVLMKANDVPFYKVLGVGAKPEEVGDDLGRAIGAYYIDVAVLKGIPTRQLPPPPPPPPSHWEAFAVAGAPFMHGAKSGDRWLGALYTTFDWAGLACGAGATAYAIEYRNEYAASRNLDKLSSANTAATTAFICLGVSVLSRGAGALHFWASH